MAVLSAVGLPMVGVMVVLPAESWLRKVMVVLSSQGSSGLGLCKELPRLMFGTVGENVGLLGNDMASQGQLPLNPQNN